MPTFIIKYRKKKHEISEHGFVASKKNFPHAVQRNRAKRLLREWTRLCKLPDEIDVILIARSEILSTTLKDGLGQVAAAIKKIKSSPL
jgi:ribonuclease P protein component